MAQLNDGAARRRLYVSVQIESVVGVAVISDNLQEDATVIRSRR
jgi:hypothetical protein